MMQFKDKSRDAGGVTLNYEEALSRSPRTSMMPIKNIIHAQGWGRCHE